MVQVQSRLAWTPPEQRPVVPPNLSEFRIEPQ